MSKNATEQYQIKKKRKHHNHNHSNNHINTNNNSNTSSNHNKINKRSNKRLARVTTTPPRAKSKAVLAVDPDVFAHLNVKRLQQQQHQLQQQLFEFHYSDYFALSPEEPPIVVDAADAAGPHPAEEAAPPCGCTDAANSRCCCCIRDERANVAAPMPLSQGFYAKGGATKRTAACKTPLTRCASVGGGGGGSVEPKRKPSSENCGRQNKCPTTAATAAFAAAASVGAAGTRPAHSSYLQFHYLLGESLARYGRLPEAFDIYAFIAAAQLDGCVPLDRLNTLASSLIEYVRQQETDAASALAAVGPQLSAASESTLTAKFAKHAAATWNMATAMPACALATATPTVPDAVVGAGLSELHAPTRELRIPSPTLADDYDPLLCPLCRDILRCPVTTNCGHTFCRQCCEAITQCNICHVKFPKGGLDEFVGETGAARSYAINTTTTTFTTTTSATSLSSASIAMTPALATAAPTASLSSTFYAATVGAGTSDNMLLARRLQARHQQQQQQPQQLQQPLVGNGGALPVVTSAAPMRLQLPAATPPTTVTTATVASTTATATTTMAAATALGGADNMKFMPDVQVRRLVEKWWGADLQAKKINETAASYMHLNLLDDALKFCNASLEKSPTNFKSLLLRAEVLRKLNHFQSSLADVDNALKSRYTSAKAHYMRSLALCELGRFDESLYENCLAISLDKSTQLASSELFQHDLAKNLQKLLAQSPRSKSLLQRTFNSATAPYTVLAEHHLRRRKQIGLLSNANGDHLSSFDDDFIACDGKCDIMAAEDFLAGGGGYASCTDKRYAIYAGMQKNYDIELRRQTSRKHFRRKWSPKETELIPSLAVDEARCGALFRSALERAQQELERLRKLDASGESPLQKQLLQIPAHLIDASDFDCVLCCRTFWKPVVTPCGHTYCWVCLDRCMDYTSSCPLCMSPLVEPNVNTMYQGSSSPVPFILAKRPVTKFLEAAMKRFIPDIYEKRFRQEMDMEPSVPVFICTTAFPYVPCPLFVYEPRYRLMVRRAVESGEKQFGIVQPHSGKSRYFDVGTILDIRDCVLLGDGCSILSTIGCKRFKILARNEKDGYETAKVEYIYDETISDENVKTVTNMHATVLTKAIEWFESLSTELKQEILQSFGEMPPVEDNWESIADGPAWAWWIIALLPLNQQLKVDILATTSLEKRLRAIEKTLDYMSGTLRRAQQHDCSVVVVQQQQHQQQQQQQQEQQCDNDLPQTCQTDECCQHTTGAMALRTSGEPHHHTNSGDHSQLML